MLKFPELVYKFPIESPSLVLHVATFKAGDHLNFKGSATYLIAACGMTNFAAYQPVTDASATTFAAVLMKILLQQSIFHTLVWTKTANSLVSFVR